jgi:hypothetical protein
LGVAGDGIGDGAGACLLLGELLDLLLQQPHLGVPRPLQDALLPLGWAAMMVRCRSLMASVIRSLSSGVAAWDRMSRSRITSSWALRTL